MATPASVAFELVGPAAGEDTLHLRLTDFNATRLRPAVPRSDWRTTLEQERAVHVLELEFIEDERARVDPLIRNLPTEAGAFVDWFEDLQNTGPGQNDPLFPYLAERATREEMCWFLTQEVAGEAGFDGLVALTQVKLPAHAKLKLARNYWDEMGRGQAHAMHGVLLDNVTEALGLDPRPTETVWEALAVANLLTGLAANRGYAYHSVGALGAVELTAPGRASMVNEGLRRLDVDAATRQYFAVHATLDIKHSEAWSREVLLTLVAEHPELARHR